MCTETGTHMCEPECTNVTQKTGLQEQFVDTLVDPDLYGDPHLVRRLQSASTVQELVSTPEGAGSGAFLLVPHMQA
jgi:hypothetical protein